MFIDIHDHATKAKLVPESGYHQFPHADELVEDLDANGIDKALLLGMVSPETPFGYITTEDVLDMCRSHPGRLIPSCNLDPRMLKNSPSSDFRAILRAYKEAGCKAVGEYVPNLAFDDPLNLNLFDQVEEVGLPLIFHVASAFGGRYGCYDDLGLPRLEKVLKECPNLKLLGHSQAWWSEIGADVTEETRGGYPKGKVTPGRVVQLMREYPNMCGDLSAGSGFGAISRDPEFGYQFLEEFQDQLFFGTDICTHGQKLPIVPYFHEIRSKSLISEEAYEKITWRNANALLNLGLE